MTICSVMAMFSYIQCVRLDQRLFGHLPSKIPSNIKEIQNLQFFSLFDSPYLQSLDRCYQNSQFCKYCNAWQPNRSGHCYDCERCIIKLDHHCPWVQNCIHGGNHNAFLMFLFYLESGGGLFLIRSAVFLQKAEMEQPIAFYIA
eukprot:TRINITY_DN25805_c0_g1_i1.p2 TRINITY_DN25805_c0_g1~~TRINITY_DN25805_c0_g1_i1.p2  ORF type:complete len:144 (+),score=7.14 TRINITY_DN25805_c0_g1_i1:123-554(+)